MAASPSTTSALRSESKSAKKKKAKTEGSSEVQASTTPTAEVASPVTAEESTNGDGSYESPYIKELYKSIRNVNKKITNASKVDNILAENPGKSLDELVASRKINKDQQAQILKKPALQASLAQLEEQIAQYKKFDQEYKTKSQVEKAEFEKTYTERANKELEDSIAATKKEAQATASKEQEDALLLLSQFLRLAAVRRNEVEKAELEESRALEGLLQAVYNGNSRAVSAMVNLIQGSSDTLKSLEGDDLNVTYADIKTAALAQEPVPEDPIEATEEAPATETAEYPTQSDPTIANAGLTELDAPSVTTAAANAEEAQEPQTYPQNSGFGEGAANAAAEANWDNANDLSASQEWVEVPRDAAETDNGVTATPAAQPNTQSWADDQPDSPKEKFTQPPANNNDGFHEVQRNRGGQNRGQGQGQGQHRGRGGRGGGENRGRGSYRGDGYRGRGRGGGQRGGRRPDES